MKNYTIGMWLISLAVHSQSVIAQIKMPSITPVEFSKVQFRNGFWKQKIAIVTKKTIPVCIEQTENKTPRIRNFEKVARNQGERFEGIYYDDSDVFKAIEAVAYSLKNFPDAKLEAKADQWIDILAAAQLPDGYLNTYYSLTNIHARWTDMEKHEDYNAGHLIEAAVAYYNTTGKKKMLQIATRLADHIDSMLRKKNRPWVSGHQEIELALVKLYHVTGKRKYLDLADWYLQQRGHGLGKGVIWENAKMGPVYCQDDKPVKEQRQIEGHAVRAMYLYSGAADVGAAKGDSGYRAAMMSVWEDVVYRNMYLTGGIGSSGSNEGFSRDYDLPNETAYCETCASVGMVLWNHRMNLLTGEAKYVDVLERSLYNGALSGLALSGDRFFYGNPLASDHNYGRSEWFGTACCPSNIARLVESVGNYIYATGNHTIYVNLFAESKTTVDLNGSKVSIDQTTTYPWNGLINIGITPVKRSQFRILLRIPGWAKNSPVPGNTYYFDDDIVQSKVEIFVNGRKIKYDVRNGYAVIDRLWDKNDQIALHLPMPVRKIRAIDSVQADKNKIALTRGPLVYCIEQLINGKVKQNFTISSSTNFKSFFDKRLLNGVVTIHAVAPVQRKKQAGLSNPVGSVQMTAIPYYSWANRGPSDMQVWIPELIESKINQPSTNEN